MRIPLRVLTLLGLLSCRSAPHLGGPPAGEVPSPAGDSITPISLPAIPLVDGKLEPKGTYFENYQAEIFRDDKFQQETHS